MEDKRIFDMYLNDIKDLPRLSQKREIELSEIILNSHDEKEVEKAVKEMVEGNVKLAVKYAFQYFRRYKTSLSEMDLIEEANIGLIKASQKYDAKTGNRFSSYAVRAITSHMDRAIQNDRFVRIPINHFKYLNNLRDLLEIHGEDATDDFLMEELGISLYMLKILKDDLKNKIIELEGDDIDLHCDLNNSTPNIELKELKSELMECIDLLSPIEKEIIFSKYFCETTITYEDIALKYDVSRQRISQISMDALSKLKRYMKNKKGGKVNEIKQIRKYRKKHHNRRSHKTSTHNGNEGEGGHIEDKV